MFVVVGVAAHVQQRQVALMHDGDGKRVGECGLGAGAQCGEQCDIFIGEGSLRAGTAALEAGVNAVKAGAAPKSHRITVLTRMTINITSPIATTALENRNPLSGGIPITMGIPRYNR